ncbi:hypothetical protein ACVC7V_07035 [Hydrogenophaga sp. A37]|uniref:hypothetical protein n=1 Tax=Hydrogenophaga sp. A37 TaxID=1945864 RepID=UPI0009CD67B1|nr:hypothetical protein [Hydrogenophaga sp. A37]OOG80466.1 hypothetical protein B0E41_20675 [Hydrogenophaga sp. A37]
MSNTSSLEPHWDTASMGLPADISSTERSALSEHLSLCCAQRGPLQSLRVGASEMGGVLAGRVVTSLLVIVLLVGGSWLML